MKKTGFTKALSLFLSLVLAFSSFGMLRFDVFAAGSATQAHWDALTAALRSENVANASFNGTNSVTVEDATGDIYNAAVAYYNVLNDYIAKSGSGNGSATEAGYGYRTSSQVRDLVKTELQSRMGTDYTTYKVANVITYLGGNVTVGSGESTTNNVSTTTVTVTVTRSSSLMSFATLDDVTSVPTYKYEITHGSRYYTTESGGCNSTTTYHYYSCCKSVSSSAGTATLDISALTAFRTELNNNASALNADQAGKIALGYDALETAFSAITEKKSAAVNRFTAAIVEHFFYADWYAKIEALEAAMKIAQYSPIVERINGYVATDISDYDLAALTVIYEALKADYDSYNAIGIDEVYAYFETDNSILVRSVVDEKFAEIENAYQIAYLREVVKPPIDSAFETYRTYDDDWVLATDNAGTVLRAALDAIDGYLESLAEYKTENVKLVFGEDFYSGVVAPLSADLNRLIQVNAYKVDFETYKSVYTTAFEPVTDAYSTAQLYAVLNARDQWYTDLQAYVAELTEYDEVLASKILTDLEAAMEAKIDSVYAMLNARVEATINNAYELYQGFVAQYGYTINTADDVNVANYTSLQSAIGLLNPTHYEFLVATTHFNMSEETVSHYNEIKSAVFAFVNYDASKGLSAYKYNHEEVGDIIRLVSATDVARDKDYTVTDENVEKIIDLLQDLLQSDLVTEKFDLSGTLNGVLDKLYTDDFLNTLVQYVYPMVAFEFAKVWAGLPTQMDDVPTGNNLAPTADITLSMYSLGQALDSIHLYLIPNLLARNVQADYPEVYAKLSQVPNTTNVKADPNDAESYVWNTNPWENANIYDAETGKLTLEWGITDKESFLNAASAALSGVAPLLFALLANQTANIGGQKIGTGSGKADCIFTINISVDPITLDMTFEGNPGYNNMLAPILSALGADNLPDGNTLTSVRSMLEDGVIAPVEQILSKIADKPLDAILSILPNIAFAFNQNLVSPLLNELKTNISYAANAKYTYSGIQSGSGSLDNVMTDSLGINLGEMLDLTSMGIDLSSMNGLVDSVIGLLTKSDDEAAEGDDSAAPVALNMPEINAARLAMLGTDVEWLTGHRTVSPYSGVQGHGSDFPRIIVGNRADVFLDVLDYLVALLDLNGGIEPLLETLAPLFASDEAEFDPDAEPDPDVEPSAGGIELPEMVQTILNNFVTNYTDSVAAVVELIAPQRYTMSKARTIDWITEGELEPGQEVYLFADSDLDIPGKTLWTKDDAVYADSHLEDIIDQVLALFSNQLGGADTLGEAAEYLLNDLLFSADTANSLVGMIRDLLGGLELPEAIAQLGLIEQLVDLHAWDEMSFDFETGDKDAFAAALTQILSPLNKALSFILAGDDLQISLLDILDVTAYGYDGYSHGLVPLLEVFGCDVMKPADFIADKENIAGNLVNAVFSIADSLLEDPLEYIRELIPAIIYFDKVDGIGVAISNLLFGVNVLLDTIRPLYDINLENIFRDLGFDLNSLGNDLIKFVMEMVMGMLQDKLGITLTMDYTIQSLAETLHFTDPIAFESANGETAYTIHLSNIGRAELFARVFDYVYYQLSVPENFAAVSDLVSGLIGEDEALGAIVDQILNNVIDNYTDSVLAIVKLMFPRDSSDPNLPTERYDMTPVRVIEWITEGTIVDTAVDPFWSTETVTGKTPWYREDAVYATNHVKDLLNGVIGVFGDQLNGAKDLGDAVDALLPMLFTAANANSLAEMLANLLGGLELPAALAEFGILEALGLDASNWAEMSFEFDDGDVAAFKAALIEIVEPLTPVLSFLLAHKELSVTVKDALTLRGLGYDGYSYGIVPLLEALGATCASTETVLGNPDKIVTYVVDAIFTVVDKLTADPMAYLTQVIPSILYFDKVDGIQVALDNLLFAVNSLLNILQPLYEVDLYDIVAQLTASDDAEGIDLSEINGDFIVSALLGLVSNLIEEKAGLNIDIEFTLQQLTDDLQFSAPQKFASANGDDAYTIRMDAEGKARLFALVVDTVIAQLGAEDNMTAVKELVGGLIGDDETVAGIVDEVLGNVTGNYTDSVLALFKLVYPRVSDRDEYDPQLEAIQKIDWITEGNIGSDDSFVTADLPEGETTLWTAEKAVYMAEHLDDFLDDIIVIFGEQLGGAENVEDAVNYLVKDLFTADNAKAVANALADLVDGFNLPDAIKDFGILESLGLDADAWRAMSFSFADGDKTAFKNALITILKPIEPLLAFLLADGTLSPVNERGDAPYAANGNIEAYLKNSLAVRGLGYDGYSYGIVPLLEALGASGVKTTAAFKADKNNVVKNIVDPLFTVVDHLIADPIKFIETVIPSLLYFDKVGGVQAAVPNLMFSVSVLLDTISPLYDGITMDDLYALIEEKTGIDITFANSDPIDLVLDLVTDLLKDNFGIEIELGTAAELTDALQFNAPKKFKSANGDDAYTVTLTADGKAELLSRILDYGINQVIAGDNFEKLNELIESLITDDDTRAMAMGILRIIKDADKDFADFHGVHDFTLASLFWVFFGADSVTDAVSDFFYRFKDSNWYEIIFMISENAPEYVERAGFLLTEVYTVEYPAFQKILEDRQALLKPPYEYNEEETQMAAGIGARIIRFFAIIIHFFKNLFKR